jgi:hypothetical protein
MMAIWRKEADQTGEEDGKDGGVESENGGEDACIGASIR